MKLKMTAATLVFAAFVPAVFAEGLLPAGDSYFAVGNNNNFGALPTINVGAGLYRGLIQFDLTTLPPGVTAATVAHANLVLFVNKIGTAGAIDINAASGTWTEAGVNGSNAPALGMTVATGVPVSTAGVYIVVDATAVVKAWLNGIPANQGLILSANSGSPGTSVFFDSKESVSTSHSASLEISLVGGGGVGPAGPVGPIGPVGPAGPKGDAGPAGPAGSGSGGGGFFQTTLFQSASISPQGSLPNTLATLTFTSPVTGTAVLSGRGFCNLLSVAASNNQVLLVGALTTEAVPFGAPFGEFGVVTREGGGPAGALSFGFTSQSTIPVVANTAYSMSLFGRHNVGATTSDCTGSLSVQVF